MIFTHHYLTLQMSEFANELTSLKSSIDVIAADALTRHSSDHLMHDNIENLLSFSKEITKDAHVCILAA